MDDISGYPGPVQEIALALLRQYGDDAEVVATLQAAEVAAMGDADGLATWDMIIACMAEMTAAMIALPPGPGH